MGDPFEPFDRIREAIERVLEPLGVNFLSWNIAPGEGDPGDERVCSILLEVTPAAFLTTEEKDTKRIFDEMLDGERVLAHEEKVREEAEAARKALSAITEQGGILPEVDDSPGA